MIQINVNYLKFGELALKSAPYDAFEVIHLKPGTNGIPVARIEVEKSEFPQLKVRALEPAELPGNAGSTATVETAVLGSWDNEVDTRFTLSVSGDGNGLQLVLSGRRKNRNFWWRSQFKIAGDEVIVQEPSLAGDPDS